MGYYATIIVLGAFLIGAMTVIAMQRDTGDADLDLANHQFKILARDAATTGLNATVWELAESYPMNSWTGGTYFNNVSYKTGTFTTTVSLSGGAPVGDTVDVISRGRSGPAKHVIFARYARDKDDVGIPPAFRNAISSDFYMQFSGNILIASIDGTRNASIHTNDDLDLRGNSFRVEGYGTYSGTVRVGPQAVDNFAPPNDWNGDEVNHMWAPEINIPTIDSVALMNRAQSGQGLYLDVGGYSSSTPFVIDGDATPILDFRAPFSVGGMNYTCTDCGTPEKPAVVYVNGPLDILNRVEVFGNVVVLATGDVSVKPVGHGGGFFGQLNGNKETEVLLATLKGIVVGDGGGNACMGLGPPTLGSLGKINEHCQSGNAGADGYTHGVSIYAEGRAELQGTPVIVGGLVAKETYMDNGGNPSVIYASANEGTLDAGFEYIVPIGPILIAYSEF